MKALAKASLVNTATQVIQHMNAGMTVIEACQTVEIPRSSFDYIMENNPEALAEVRAMIDANNREQLGLILLSKTEMLQRIIEDGLSETTKPKDRLAIYVKLNELVDRLTDTLHIDSQMSKDANEFLKRGPQLVHARSRLTATETTITYETEG